MFIFFFFNDSATTAIYTLSLHDALPISHRPGARVVEDVVAHRRRTDVAQFHAPPARARPEPAAVEEDVALEDRKSTRLNSSHSQISYAVFCLKKKKTDQTYSVVTSYLYY